MQSIVHRYLRLLRRAAGQLVLVRSYGRSLRIVGLSLVLAVLFSSQMALAQFSQQQKLVGTGATGKANQGASVSLSVDPDNTAIVGGPGDDSSAGAAWVFTRSGGVWTQQGSKLVGTGATGKAHQGASVSLDVFGNTAILGGPGDDNSAGAAWVFTRSGGVWTQQGSKLVGTGATGKAHQGASVSLSFSGNTAIVGGPGDDSSAGAAWVFTRSGGVWTQQGIKLVGTGATGKANQGASVSLDADGKTAIVGGPGDNNGAGAAWVFVGTQQGSKLVGTGATGKANQGASVSLDAHGKTAIVGGPGDNNGAGAAWVFVGTQQGSKLVGTGATGKANQGASVSLSADGKTVIVGGPGDNNGAGAAWVFVGTQQGSKLVGTGRQGELVFSGFNTAIVGGPGDNNGAGAARVYVRTVPKK